MDWLHCNRCFTEGEQNLFVFSNCGHIFCRRCHQEKPNFCTNCKKECKFVKVDDNLSHNLRSLFSEVTSSLDSLTDVIKLQTSQRIDMIKFYKKNYFAISKKYDYLKKLYTDINMMCRKKDAECKKLQQELERLKAENDRIKTLTLHNHNIVNLQTSSKQVKMTKQSKRTPQSRYLESIANMTVVSESNASARSRSPTSLGGFGAFYPQLKKRL